MTDLVRLFDFLPGTLIKSSEVDAEFSQLVAEANKPFSAYRTIFHAAALVQDFHPASTVLLPDDIGFLTSHGEAIQSSNLGLLTRIEAADYAVSGRTTKLRVRATVVTDAVASAITFTCGLHPINAPSAGNWQFGAAVAGSTAAIASPAANSLNEADSGDFNIPADGYYGLAIVKSGAGTATFDAMMNIQLQQRWT